MSEHAQRRSGLARIVLMVIIAAVVSALATFFVLRLFEVDSTPAVGGVVGGVTGGVVGGLIPAALGRKSARGGP